jgi:Fe2+ transport system protein FeoA
LINNEEGSMVEVAVEAMSLDKLASGETGYIRDIQGGRGFVSRLATLGFTIGVPISMVQNFRRGPLIVMVRDSRVALGRDEANKISINL